MATIVWPHQRPPTVNDLRTKLCWICRETDDRSDGPWCHPCSCTLVCHSGCLLTWIDQAAETTGGPSGALKCPQCSSIYKIHSNRPTILRWLDGLNLFFSQAGRLIAVVTLSGTILTFGATTWFLLSIYGADAVESFLGREAYELLLGDDPSRWPITAWLDLPLIPFALVASRAGYFGPLFVILPWSTALPAFYTRAGGGPGTISYPPSPVWSLVLFPFIRRGYSIALTHLSRRILRHSGPVPPSPTVGLYDRAALVQEHLIAEVHVQDADDEADPGINAIENRQFRITGSTLGRLLGGALVLPRLSNVMGNILLLLSRYSSLLQRLLGVGSARPKPAFYQISSLGLQRQWAWAELDPVWWRNSIGLGIYLIVMDSLALYHARLQQSERRSRRVLSRSFEGVDLSGLDLKI